MELNIITGIGTCNLKCRMCPQANKNYKREFIEFEVFKKIIDNVPVSQNIKINLTPFTETFLMPNLLEIIEYASDRRPNAETAINTNGVILTDEMARGLVSSRLKNMLFSLNMNSAEDYKWFTGFDKYDIVCKNIVKMREIRDQMKSEFPRIAVQLMDIPRNQIHKAAFHEKWVVGYGHSSVAEHAVVRLAIENVSLLSVEWLQDPRPPVI